MDEQRAAVVAAVVAADRARYEPLLRAAGLAAVAAGGQLGAESNDEHLTVYVRGAWAAAKMIANAIYVAGDLGRYAMVMHRGASLVVAADGRDLVTVCESFGVPEAAVLGIWMSRLGALCDVAQAALWPAALSWLRGQLGAAGGRRGRRTKPPASAPGAGAPNEVLDMPDGVLVGVAATALLLGERPPPGARQQVISADVRAAAAAGRCHSLADPHAISDPRLRRLTCEAAGGKRDIYNAAEYSLVPFTERGGARVGTPLLVAYYRLVDAWIVLQLLARGSVEASYAKHFAQEAWRDSRRLARLALAGDPAEQLPVDGSQLYGTIRDQARELRKTQKQQVYMPASAKK